MKKCFYTYDACVEFVLFSKHDLRGVWHDMDMDLILIPGINICTLQCNNNEDKKLDTCTYALKNPNMQ